MHAHKLCNAKFQSSPQVKDNREYNGRGELKVNEKQGWGGYSFQINDDDSSHE